MKSFGRLMQKLGLFILPISMLLEVAGMLGRSGVSHMVILLVFGVSLFYAGRLLEGYARS